MSFMKKQKCGSKMFQCNNGKCIAANFVCDGEPECSDGSDEAPDLCKKQKSK